MLKLFVVAATMLLLIVMPLAEGGDEVDYSAPYLVVENGELVTKYPTREHEGAATAAGTAANSGSDNEMLAPGSDPRFRKTWIVAIIAIAAVAGFLAWARRRSQHEHRDDDSD